MIGRRTVMAGLAGALVASPLDARAQQGERVRRVGILMPFPPANAEVQARVRAFREELRERFFAEYERQFHSVSRDIRVEVAAIRVRGTRTVTRPSIPFRGGGTAYRPSSREVVTAAGVVHASVVPRDALPAGTHLDGPLILHQTDTTTWVPPTWDAEVDPLGNLLMNHRG